MKKLVSLGVGAAFVLHLHVGSAQDYFVPPGVSPTPIFVEDFEGVELDAQRWSQRVPGRKDQCINEPSAVTVDSGYLTIRTYSLTHADGEVRHHCGMISTQDEFMATYGYWEAAVRFKHAPGVRVAFSVQSPTMGSVIGEAEKSGVEMGVFEHLSDVEQSQYAHALQWDGYGAEHKAWSHLDQLPTLADGEFHTFGLLWAPDRYEFYVDGQLSQRVSANVPISRTPQAIRLSSDIARADAPQAGYGDRHTAQTEFDVDYVRVYPLLR